MAVRVLCWDNKVSRKELPLEYHFDHMSYTGVSAKCLACGQMYFRKTHIKGLQKDLVVYWYAAGSKTVKMVVSHECYTSGMPF